MNRPVVWNQELVNKRKRKERNEMIFVIIFSTLFMISSVYIVSLV